MIGTYIKHYILSRILIFKKMKVFMVLLSVIQVCFVSSYLLKPILVNEGIIEAVDFDLDGNTYTAAVSEKRQGEEEHVLFKISPDNKVLWGIIFPSWVKLTYKLFITKQNDIYLFLYGDSNSTFAIYRPDSQKFEIIEKLGDNLFFLDDNDNLFFTGEYGIQIFRPGSTKPVQIKNLEKFSVFRTQNTLVDRDGNVYFGVNSDITYNNSMALITKEELQNEIPEAKFLDVLDSDSQLITGSLIDDDNNLWVFLTDQGAKKVYVKKLENGVITEDLAEDSFTDIAAISAKDRIYVIEGSLLEYIRPRIYFITLDKEIVTIPELEEFEPQKFFIADAVADQNGTAYFKSFNLFNYELGSMFIINAGETKPIPVSLEDPEDIIDYIYMDYNEDVWLLTNNEYVYLIKKSETVANKIKDFKGRCYGVYSNLAKKKVYVACYNAFYVAVNEK